MDRLELNCCPAKTQKSICSRNSRRAAYERLCHGNGNDRAENASDILASAKDLNEERAAKEAEEAAAAQLESSEEE